MYTIKGFVTNDSLSSADPSVIPAFGEISTKSMTYATGVGEYNNSSYSGFSLYAFSSKTVNGDVTVPVALQAQIFAVVSWAYQYQKTQQAALTAQQFTVAMTGQFPQNATAIGCGSLISNGTFSMPEYITWINPSITSNDPAVGASVKIWLCDASFQNQYDEYEIVVIPPLSSINVFTTGAASVRSALAAVTQNKLINSIQTARNQYPETILENQSFDYVDPTNPSNRITTNWALLIYGQAGNNLDNIKAAVQKYVLANSQSSLTTWKAILPDLYSATEFYILPRWSSVAIRALTLQSGAYSAVVQPAREVAYVKNFFSGEPSTYVENNLAIIPSNYKSLELLCIGDYNNQTSEQNIWTLFPDIINVPSTDALYNMMSSNTRAWLTMIEEMILVAETATLQSSLPAGMSRAVRNNVLFIAQEFNGVNYLVSTYSSTPGY